MKLNQLGTLVIMGVVVSFTAACNGSPTRPTAIAPSLGDGASAASVNLSTPMSVSAADQACTSQPQPDQGGDQTDEVQNVNTPTLTCDSSTSTEPPGDVVVGDSPSMGDARFVRGFYR